MKVNTIYQGNALEVQGTFPDNSIDMCMTSPPYWGLRDYGLSDHIWDGHDDCEHEWGSCQIEHDNLRFRATESTTVGSDKNPEIRKGKEKSSGQFCQKCGAWKGQLGLEPTPDLYINHLCDIFDETWRVLKDSGSLWVNISDSYSSQGGPQVVNTINAGRVGGSDSQNAGQSRKVVAGCKPKSLVGIPERFVLEMMNRGWIRRNTIIWFKPNCMPSSVKDRFTVDFEYIYFFTKKRKYYFEQQFEPLSEESIRDIKSRKNLAKSTGEKGSKHHDNPESVYSSQITGRLRTEFVDLDKGRNKRSVWRISPKPFKGAHFAVFPEELCETPIKAGSPRGGICLDPFFGSGTLGVVARRLGRNFVGIELNPDYIEIAKNRLKKVQQELDV